jgi:hypothetical protein
MSDPQRKPTASSSTATQQLAEIANLKIDERQLTQQDLDFEAFVHRRALVNCVGGAAIGGGLPWFAMRRLAKQGKPRPGGVISTLLISGMTLGGLAGGVMLTSFQVTQRLGELDNDSYIKKLANQLLVARYPMAVADVMEERKKRQQQPEQKK